MNAQQISWLPEEVRNHIAQLERDIDRVTAERDEAIADRDRHHSKAWEIAAEREKALSENTALRARVAELVRELSHVADCSQNRDAENMLLQQRNAELVAALREIAEETADDQHETWEDVAVRLVRKADRTIRSRVESAAPAKDEGVSHE